MQKYHKNMITCIILTRIICENPFARMKMNTSIKSYQFSIERIEKYLTVYIIERNSGLVEIFKFLFMCIRNHYININYLLEFSRVIIIFLYYRSLIN